MVYVSRILTLTLAALQIAWSAVWNAGTTGWGGDEGNLQIRLIQAPFSATPQTQWSELTEANFSGYTAGESIQPSPVAVGGVASAVGPTNVSWQGETASPFVPNNIYGYALTTETSSTITMVASEAFTAPVAIAVAGDWLSIELLFPMQTPGVVQ